MLTGDREQTACPSLSIPRIGSSDSIELRNRTAMMKRKTRKGHASLHAESQRLVRGLKGIFFMPESTAAGAVT